MEELKVIDFSAVDEIVDKVSEGGYSFSEYVNMFAQGENSLNYRGITDSVIDIARNEVLDVKKILTEMLFVVVAAAIFVNLSKIFKSRQVSESGFYITYMLMFVLMASCFGGLYNTSKETLDMAGKTLELSPSSSSSNSDLYQLIQIIINLLKLILDKDDETIINLNDREVARALKDMGVVFG